ETMRVEINFGLGSKHHDAICSSRVLLEILGKVYCIYKRRIHIDGTASFDGTEMKIVPRVLAHGPSQSNQEYDRGCAAKPRVSVQHASGRANTSPGQECNRRQQRHEIMGTEIKSRGNREYRSYQKNTKQNRMPLATAPKTCGQAKQGNEPNQRCCLEHRPEVE